MCCGLIVGCQPYQPMRHQGRLDLAATMRPIKLGMHKAQVADLAGAPVAVDPFDEDQWTYWQIDSRYGKTLCRQGKRLIFKKDRLQSIHTIQADCAKP